MDEYQVERLLKKTYKLAQDNNRLLHSIKRAETIKSVFGVLKMIVIAGLIGGVYFMFIKPISQTITEEAGKIIETQQRIQNINVNIPTEAGNVVGSAQGWIKLMTDKFLSDEGAGTKDSTIDNNSEKEAGETGGNLPG